MLPYVYMSVELPYSIFIHWKYSISRNKNGMTYVMHYGMISSFFNPDRPFRACYSRSMIKASDLFLLRQCCINLTLAMKKATNSAFLSGNIAPDRNYF